MCTIQEAFGQHHWLQRCQGIFSPPRGLGTHGALSTAPAPPPVPAVPAVPAPAQIVYVPVYLPAPATSTASPSCREMRHHVLDCRTCRRKVLRSLVQEARDRNTLLLPQQPVVSPSRNTLLLAQQQEPPSAAPACATNPTFAWTLVVLALLFLLFLLLSWMRPSR